MARQRNRPCLRQLAEPKALPEWQQNGCVQMYMNKEQELLA